MTFLAQRSRRFFPEALHRRTALLFAPALVAFGVAAEWRGFGWDDPRRWLPDLATGWVLATCGLIAWWRRPDSRGGPLLLATAAAWFLPNFAVSSGGAVAWLAGHALYLHRGPLVHLVVTFPNGRMRGWRERVTVTAGYAAAVVMPVWRSELVTIVLAAALPAAAIVTLRGTTGQRRLERVAALRATALLGCVLAVGAALRLSVPTSAVQERTLLGYEGALVAFAVATLAALARSAAARAELTDVVVELGETPSAGHRDALARVLGDPSLDVAYRLDGGGYVDSAGRPLRLPSHGSGRTMTPVRWAGREVAVVVHDPAVLDDPLLLDALASSARLAAVNAQLQAELRTQVAEVRASRLRLLRAGDDERKRLERRLREGAERRLLSMRELLREARRIAPTATAPVLARADERLERTIEDMRELAAGLHPRELAERGLESALEELASRSPVPVVVACAAGDVPVDIGVAVYFVCTEALANAAKHAFALQVTIMVAHDVNRLRIEIADDGVGGADADGTGLRGLADRVATLGGTLAVDSPSGAGTRLQVDVPLHRPAPEGNGGPTRRHGPADMTN